MKLSWLVAVIASGVMSLIASAATAPSQWEQPAASLAEEIAGVLGPGQAHLTIRNNSSIATDEIPAIRRLLVRELKTRGVTTSEADTANILRVTLSENLRERLWVAEIVEGNETRVAMVHVELGSVSASPSSQDRVVLRKQLYLTSAEQNWRRLVPSIEPLLASIETKSGLVVLRQRQILVFAKSTAGWQEQKSFDLNQRQQQTRDPRGILLPTTDGTGFTAFTPGTECSGSYTQPIDTSGHYGEWSVLCHLSDDPWPIAVGPITQADATTTTVTLKTFYNSARNYFTGVVTPSLGVDLPPFYTASLLPRPSGAAFLFNGIDGKVQLVENAALKPVSGTRDWGSDFAALNSGCGAGTQIIASGSGEAAADSLRAYELPALEAVPASAPLALEGTVTALWSAPDGKSVFAIVRKTANPGSTEEYEVDRVTASCNE